MSGIVRSEAMIWVETVRVCESVEMDRRVFEEREVEHSTALTPLPPSHPSQHISGRHFEVGIQLIRH